MHTYKVRKNLDEKERNELIGFHDIVAHLLFHRGIKNKDEAEVFLSPKYDKGIHDPFLLHDMDKAVSRILKAIEKKEKICIYSDYDADGIPGAVVLHDLFKKIGYDNFINYIPDRSEEGFGLNIEAIEKLKKENVSLMITVDCGIGDTGHIDSANDLGIDVIVTDHHLPGENLPKAFAIVNPKISPDYPDQMLCGAGVAFKLAQGILAKNRFGLKEGEEKWLLDMVGIATLSDMVPLINENRIFAYFGLMVLRKSRRIGLIKLLQKLAIDQSKLTEDDVGFMITPRINAASRMGVSYDAFKLLTTTDQDEALMLVDKLEKVNKERKSTTAYLTKEVKKHIEAKYSPYFNNKVIVAGDPSWKPSILGLVANSLAEKEMKPVFLWGRDGVQETLKGSCRSVGGISITDIMTSVTSGVFTEFGGHHLAGGFSVSHETVHLLDEELLRAYEKCGSMANEVEKTVDATLSLSEIDNNFVKNLEKLAPFGIGNPKPMFMIPDAEVIEVTMFGKTKEHLKVLFLKPNGGTLEAISFFASPKMLACLPCLPNRQATGMEKAKDLSADKAGKKTLSIVGMIERSFFLGRESLRIRIEEIIA